VDEPSTADKEFSGTRHAELVLDVASATKRVQPQRLALGAWRLALGAWRLALGAEVFGLSFGEHGHDPPILDSEAVTHVLSSE